MINIESKENCCGCCACLDVCPTKAIAMQVDNEGFWYPKVDVDLCVNCSLCEKTCPELQASELKTNDYNPPKCYAAINENLEVRFDSTSGGLFSSLADKTYRDGGYVGGAVYNDDFSVRNFMSNNKADLVPLRSSKYLQSDASGLYAQIKELLKSGEKVLVCGTPCQMAALRCYLGRKEYENLLIVDFICRGVNSPKIFRKFLDSLETQFKSKVVYFKSKSKELGWRALTSKVVFENGEVKYDVASSSFFAKGYLKTNSYCRPSCYDCKFKELPRIADITIADFWGIEKAGLPREYDLNLGTSLVMVNSKKGEAYFESVKKKAAEVPFSAVTGGNASIYKSLPKPNINREEFFGLLDAEGFDAVAKKYIAEAPIKVKRRRRIKNKIKGYWKFFKTVCKSSGWNLPLIWENIKINLFRKNIKTDIVANKYILIRPYSLVDIHKKAVVTINGVLNIGQKKMAKSRLETRFLLEAGATFTCGNFILGYGSCVEVFGGGKLTLGNGSGTNTCATIICGKEITIGAAVMMGRGVTIRDNNGGHYMSIRGYKVSKAVEIGQHSWLCEGCTIMQGTKLGTGVIVGAKAYLPGGRYKSHTLLVGNPATVVSENVYWKY